MKLTIFGATGGTGRQLVEQSLAAGHEVTALARTPAKLGLTHPKLTVVQGDVLNPAQVANAVAGANAVLSALGTSTDSPDGVLSNGVQHIIGAMNAHGVKRIVAVSSLGVGDSKDQIPLAFKLLIQTMPLLKKSLHELEQMETFLKQSNLDWIVVRPGGLTNDPPTGNYQFGLDRKIRPGRISRGDVAAFMLKQLTDDTFVRKTPAVT
jgi:putative NADH-flavin reductase